MRTELRSGSHSRLLAGATVVLCLLVGPLVAAGASPFDGPDASTSASVRSQLKKLKRQVAALRAQVEGSVPQPGPQGPPGPPGPSTGPAGGDLSGTYPDPQIGPGTIGTLEHSSIPAVRVFAANTQPIDNPSEAIEYPGETYDTANMHSTTTNTSRFVAPVTGLYLLTAAGGWPQDMGIAVRRFTLRRNGTDDLASAAGETSQVALGVSVSTVARFNAGDYAELIGIHLLGSAQTVTNNHFTMTWIAPG